MSSCGSYLIYESRLVLCNLMRSGQEVGWQVILIAKVSGGSRSGNMTGAQIRSDYTPSMMKAYVDCFTQGLGSHPLNT